LPASATANALSRLGPPRDLAAEDGEVAPLGIEMQGDRGFRWLQWLARFLLVFLSNVEFKGIN